MDDYVMVPPSAWVKAQVSTQLDFIRYRLEQALKRGCTMTCAPYTPEDVSRLRSDIAYIDGLLAAAPTQPIDWDEAGLRMILREELRRYGIDPTKEGEWAIAGEFACLQAMKRVAVASPKPSRESVIDDERVKDLRTLKTFLEIEALDYVRFASEMQARRTLDYQARGDADADYRGLSGVEETKYWPFIQITNEAIRALSHTKDDAPAETGSGK